MKIEELSKLASFIGKTVVGSYDTVLFDVTDNNLTAIDQSDWGLDYIDDLGSFIKQSISENGHANIENKLITLKEMLGRVSVFYSRDEDRVYAFVIIFDCSLAMKMSNMLSQVLNFDNNTNINADAYRDNIKAKSLDDIPKLIKAFGVEPDKLTLSEKKELFIDLYDSAVFTFKGAVPVVAKELGMSEQSVYRYISKIREARK